MCGQQVAGQECLYVLHYLAPAVTAESCRSPQNRAKAFPGFGQPEAGPELPRCEGLICSHRDAGFNLASKETRKDVILLAAILRSEAMDHVLSLADEMAGAEFGDKRLSSRLQKIVERFGDAPNMSIPAVTRTRGELEATYRFCNNKRVTPEACLAPHAQKTIERVQSHDVVLFVQDTTELDLTRPTQQVRGAGPLACESRRGALFHPLMAINTEGVPLGIVWHKLWARESIRKDQTPAEKSQRQKTTPIEDKESIRWVEGFRQTVQVAKRSPNTSCVCIGDSDSDVYELFAEALQAREADGATSNVHMIVRGTHPRRTESGPLYDAVRSVPCIATNSIQVSACKAKLPLEKGRGATRAARIAHVEVRARSLVLSPPPRFDRNLPPVPVNVVLVEEPQPPSGEAPIQWLLITTLPISDHDEVVRVIEYYRRRWQIEIYFRTLKSGCRIEERQFETIDRISNCLILYAISAWRLLYLMTLGRTCPDMNCELVFEPSEWKAVYAISKSRQIPDTPPSLNELIRMIANLGGYVMRPKTEPGTQTLWIGLQALCFLASAWDTFGPGS